MRWWLPCLFVLAALQPGIAEAQAAATACPQGAVCVPIPRQVALGPAERDYGRVSFGAGVFGAVASGLVLSGSIAMAASDTLGDEVAARASLLGLTAAAAPVIAFSALATRNRVELRAQRQILLWAVSAWLGAAIHGGLQLSSALRGLTTPPELTLVAGAVGCVGLSAFTLDAFTTAHRARIKQNYRVVAGLSSVTIRF